MLQNPCKTLGFKKNMVYKIPPGGGGKPYPASGLNEVISITLITNTAYLFKQFCGKRRKILHRLKNMPCLCNKHYITKPEILLRQTIMTDMPQDLMVHINVYNFFFFQGNMPGATLGGIRLIIKCQNTTIGKV